MNDLGARLVWMGFAVALGSALAPFAAVGYGYFVVASSMLPDQTRVPGGATMMLEMNVFVGAACSSMSISRHSRYAGAR